MKEWVEGHCKSRYSPLRSRAFAYIMAKIKERKTMILKDKIRNSFFAGALLLSVSPATTHAAALNNNDVLNALVPHKALYDIKMVARKNSSQVLNISGQMFFEWNHTCDAWTTDHRFNLKYEYADSAPMNITSDFSTYETFDGKSLDFNSRRKRNGDLYQEIRGRAEAAKNNETAVVEVKSDNTTKGEAVYTMPTGLVYDLDDDMLFPMAHTVEMLKHAEQGKRFYNARVFDGSDEDGPVEINSFIGKEKDTAADSEERAGVDSTLIHAPAWNVRMAFFPAINPESEADYEMSAIFHNNGVISDMLVEYSDFSVTQKLVALERLDAEKCE